MLLLFSSLKMFPGRKIFKLMWIKRLNKYYRRLFIRCELHCFHMDTVRCAHRLPSIAASQRTETQNECWTFPFNILIRWCSDVQLFKLTTSYGIRMRHQHHHHKMNSENFQASNWVLTAKFCLIYCLTVQCVCVFAFCNIWVENYTRTHVYAQCWHVKWIIWAADDRNSSRHRTHTNTYGMKVVANGRAKI